MSRTVDEYYRAWFDLALVLFSAGAFVNNRKDPRFIEEKNRLGFKLKLHEAKPKAQLSPFLLDLRAFDHPCEEPRGPLPHSVVVSAAERMRHLMLDNQVALFDAIVGIPYSGEPFGISLAHAIRKRHFPLDKWKHKDKTHVADFREPVDPSVSHVLLVDDVITCGYSKREAIDILRDQDIKVTDVVVLIDCEQGGRKALAKLGCQLHAVFTLTQLLDIWVDMGQIDPNIRKQSKKYLSNVQRV
jgi:orotate phosphoribosyltransferase